MKRVRNTSWIHAVAVGIAIFSLTSKDLVLIVTLDDEEIVDYKRS